MVRYHHIVNKNFKKCDNCIFPVMGDLSKREAADKE
jgi:hypothetical protein